MENKEITEMANYIPKDIITYNQLEKGLHLYIEQRYEIAEELYNKGYRKECDLLARIEELEGQLAYECKCNKQFVECQNKCEQLERENADLIVKNEVLQGNVDNLIGYIRRTEIELDNNTALVRKETAREIFKHFYVSLLRARHIGFNLSLDFIKSNALRYGVDLEVEE